MRRPHRSRRDDQSGVRTDRATDQRAERFAAERTVLRDRCHEWARDNLPGAFYEAGARLPTSDDGYAVAIVVGSRTWRVRTVLSTHETTEKRSLIAYRPSCANTARTTSSRTTRWCASPAEHASDCIFDCTRDSRPLRPGRQLESMSFTIGTTLRPNSSIDPSIASWLDDPLSYFRSNRSTPRAVIVRATLRATVSGEPT